MVAALLPELVSPGRWLEALVALVARVISSHRQPPPRLASGVPAMPAALSARSLTASTLVPAVPWHGRVEPAAAGVARMPGLSPTPLDVAGIVRRRTARMRRLALATRAGSVLVHVSGDPRTRAQS
jgi:hypothetical protein